MCVEFILSYLSKWEIAHGPPLAATDDSDGGFLVSGNRTEGPEPWEMLLLHEKMLF